MAWNVDVGSPSEEMKSLEDERSEHVLALVPRELSPSSQDLVRLSVGDRATLKRSRQSMGSRQDEVDDDEIVDDQAYPLEKKRRLTPSQAKYLEMNFEMENKLGPERKALIAHHLDLRPRQVAIWFQNRRARWKNKQLEQDYESLKAKYEGVLEENEKVMKENAAMLEENKILQAKLASIMALLQVEDLNGLGDGALELRKASNEGQNEDGSLVSAKSELASPTKSEDQSEVQDSGRSYTPPAEDVVASGEEQVLMVADFNETGMTRCPVVKLEEQALLSEELLETFFNPLVFHHLAASGFCLEETRWDDQSPSFSLSRTDLALLSVDKMPWE